MQVMYRCHIIARSMLIFELFAIFDPDQIKIDPFELFKTQGGFCFNAFCGPTGFATRTSKSYGIQFLTAHENYHVYSKKNRKVQEAWVSLQQGLMIAHFKNFKDGNKAFHFLEVWNKIAPEPQRSDLARALQLEQLFKYHATFLSFSDANELKFQYQDKWVSQTEHQHANRHYNNVSLYRNRFEI